MAKVYLVIENGYPYPDLYSTYQLAREAVATKYAEELESQREFEKEMKETYNPNFQIRGFDDVVENETGTTKLYIEKEIYITIHRYKIPN
jgi:hypothetical protein